MKAELTLLPENHDQGSHRNCEEISQAIACRFGDHFVCEFKIWSLDAVLLYGDKNNIQDHNAHYCYIHNSVISKQCRCRNIEFSSEPTA